MRSVGGATVAIDDTSTVLRRWGGSCALTDVEQQRAAAFRRVGDRDDFVAARLLARECVSRVTGVSTDEVEFIQRCEVCAGPHGRPQVTGSELQVSWSRSQGRVAAAAGHEPLGIDLERTDRPLEVSPALLARSMTAGEIAVIEAAPDRARSFRDHWVRKEAMVKVGLISLDEFHLAAAVPAAALTLFDLGQPGVAAGLAIRCRPAH